MPMEANPMETNPQAKCHFCDECDGHGCVSELPGMGGAYENENFIRNHADWDAFADGKPSPLPAIRLAPITGAVQNVGYHDEKSFYLDIMGACARAGIKLSAGDGYPDEKLKFGIEALSTLARKGAVFIKPYENRIILDRMEWASHVAEIVGVDIDSYAILTMRNLVNLQRKTASDLLEIKRRAGREGLPFAIKGVFRPEDIELVREVKPDIVVISNHGGRVETLRGSTVAFLAERGAELSRHAGALWVDGGIRTRRHLETASSLGATEVMIGRPLISALLRDGADGVRSRVAKFFS
jgi:isopentenyl diphosphate isomerase/L-lactate dehydrogenase-like FMN-dependent dehydrogenase